MTISSDGDFSSEIHSLPFPYLIPPLPPQPTHPFLPTSPPTTYSLRPYVGGHLDALRGRDEVPVRVDGGCVELARVLATLLGCRQLALDGRVGKEYVGSLSEAVGEDVRGREDDRLACAGKRRLAAGHLGARSNAA